MIIYIINNLSLKTFLLPIQVKGSYTITDEDNNKRVNNLVNIEQLNDSWQMVSNDEYSLIVNGSQVNSTILQKDTFYFLKSNLTNEIVTLFTSGIYDNETKYGVYGNQDIIVGRDGNCHIAYNNSLIAMQQAKISYVNNMWTVENLDATKPIYINGNPIFQNTAVYHGSILFIMGLKIIFLGNTLIINNPAGSVNVALAAVETQGYNLSDEVLPDDNPNMILYNKNDYFSRAPRFRNTIEKVKIVLDNPPSKIKEDTTPLILTVGPMSTMGMMALVSIYSGVNNAITNGRGITSALPSIVMGVAMLCSMVVWPLVTKKYSNKMAEKGEFKRRDLYEKYIQQKRQEITSIITKQRLSLLEDYMSLEECVTIIKNNRTKLWERKIEEDDFLKVRLGLGVVPLQVDIQYPTEKFTVEDDILKEIIRNFVDEARDISGAPVTISFLEKRISGIVGNDNLTSSFLLGIILQLITYYSSDILKIVVLTNEQKAFKWEPLKTLVHNWSNDNSIRFFGTNSDEIKQIMSYLDKEYSTRIEESGNATGDVYVHYPTYYLILTDDYKQVSESSFIKKILKANINYGFSLIITNEKLSNLPNECVSFININQESSGLIENELVSSKQKEFIAEFPTAINMQECCSLLANIPINIETKSKGLPDSYEFLEMYNVGKVEQLNSVNRWKTNDPTISLATPIGMDENGDIFKIDLHEKFHGPHGLVAGTTGSGKSEWIITFILSMAVNYSPNEVSFVLIDYKGGGLALAFENKDIGIKLPHIAGTITNLDTGELNRSLISIQSELKRRQREFNKAREISGESTIDIYKYQRLYRAGVVKNPISHLFIISDEFAELKSQQPEFMDQLVSTARIGRSLGVHLILATQKPSGVVNDQIWSNSRFKVCLKVQDKADSVDMIRTDEAASIKQPGRFYLLVGYNDYFALGQSAYSSMPYIPSETAKRKIDTSIQFVNNTGYIIKQVDDVKIIENAASQGEVLLNVVKYLTTVATQENIRVNQLWLDNIPSIIYLSELLQKYSYQKEAYVINPIIGEYDNPANQSQHLLTLPLTNNGNAIIFGMTGSGKEDLLVSLVYFLITTYTTEELNLYLLDCGSETLKIFDQAPQVGDVIVSSEVEKVANLFRMLFDILDERKKAFSSFGGSINVYNKYNEKKYHNVVVIINNFENFLELFSPLEEVFIKLTREATKYGILFIITAAASNSVRLKIRQNFTQNIALQLTDQFDYINILGNTNKMVPSSIKGRGLVKIDNVYEFQSASICPEENLMDFIKSTITDLEQKNLTKAKRVPILPEVVNVEYLKTNSITLDNLPLGVYKNDLKIASYNFKDAYMSIITTTNVMNLKHFVNGFSKLLALIPNLDVKIFDYVKVTANGAYVSETEDAFGNIINALTFGTAGQLLMIIGINELLSTLSSEEKKEFDRAILTARNNHNTNIVIIESFDNLKKYQFDEWYKNINSKNGIWIGNNIIDQSVLKVGKITKNLYDNIGNDFGYIVTDGIPVLFKVVTENEENAVEELEF